LTRKTSPRCRLLFLAVNWIRKGGDIAFDTLLKLVESGVDAELIVCGCVPPHGVSHERMTVIPFLNKDDPLQLKTLTGLLLASDFLLLPTRYDCTPIVFCEANAFGTPVITTDTGGASGLIKNGENGFMLPPSAGGAEYAETICSVYRDDRRYAELRGSSRAAFEDRLNWNSWAIAVSRVLAEVV
jgi:glycosyltransferase involved in cell wall biosynthesis